MRPLPPDDSADAAGTISGPAIAGVTERVREVFERRLHIVSASTDSELIGARAIDSLAFVTLLTALEAEFDVRIEADDFELRHFASIDAIAAFLVTRYGPLRA